jgi:hypothetical protein
MPFTVNVKFEIIATLSMPVCIQHTFVKQFNINAAVLNFVKPVNVSYHDRVLFRWLEHDMVTADYII